MFSTQLFRQFSKLLLTFTFLPEIRVLVDPHPYRQNIISLIIAPPVYIKWYLTVVLIYVSLITKDIEDIFKCLLAIDIL